MERESAAFVDQNIFCGFLEMETKANSGVFQRRFLRLDPDASTLEYFADRQQVVCICGSLVFFVLYNTLLCKYSRTYLFRITVSVSTFEINFVLWC